jgi:hypothetical protein
MNQSKYQNLIGTINAYVCVYSNVILAVIILTLDLLFNWINNRKA